MNFGPKANGAFNNQQPTYHLAPNFTTRPFPDGPLDLGTLVEDLQFHPINLGAARVAIPEGQRYTDAKEDVIASLKSSVSGEASILARVLDSSIGGDASLKGQRKEENVYKIQKLETVYFHPQPSYIKQCLQLGDVRDYMEMANYREPVHLITGLKIAWGATISTERGRDLEGKAGADVRVPGGLVDAQVGGHAAVSSASGALSSFGKPADLVLGIQVLKIYHKRAFFIGEPTLATKRVVRNAVLVDDEPVVEDEDDETFKVADLGSSEVEGLVSCTEGGDDGIWLLPRDLV
ncbi:hypothetical protein CONLIGDRAFT_682722 [Coniochaeta ligniaria NRRL 30616]|uniref:Uncharacterized protein n=1 Tax=Coniochaeta ligniaria NRRL 30616 TaxID=1408157 RepID=A0A1J7JJ79_9PEZI|nr:hypothetical protein CONLIGDRAFT_682722 [Coniochaeta ligniaria NRRL 30616]